MNPKLKPAIGYVFYLIHFMAVMYVGITESHSLTGWTGRPAFAISFMGIGAILYIPAFWELGAKKSSHTHFSGLVTTGSYAVIRNPQMLGWFIALLGISFYLNSLISLILTFALWIFFKTVLQPMEECVLTQQYGKQYLDYKRNTISGI